MLYTFYTVLIHLRYTTCSSEDNADLPIKSWVSFRSASSSRPGSRRMAKREQYSRCSQHVPVDQVVLLPRRIQARNRQSGAVLITSEAGMAKFWDLFGHKRPIGKSVGHAVH